MGAPDDFGLDGVATLGRVGHATPPPGFTQFFSRWPGSTPAATPLVADDPAIDPAAAGAAGVTHVVHSFDGVRLGVRLVEGGTVDAVVVRLHGYAVPPGAPLAADADPPGLASCIVRIRGYPGSQADTGDLTRTPGGFATLHAADPASWSIAAAVGDVVAVYGALRARYGDAVPVWLEGESFGGGLAVVASSVLGARHRVGRLVLGLPSLGDWPWRLDHPAASGIGGEIAALLAQRPEDAEAITAAHALYDAVEHARRVYAPVLCKLALRDEVVPAPTAAAIFNALASDPGSKWRFLVACGHCESDMANARRHALFCRVARDFLDPARDPRIAMAAWEPRLTAALDDHP